MANLAEDLAELEEKLDTVTLFVGDISKRIEGLEIEIRRIQNSGDAVTQLQQSIYNNESLQRRRLEAADARIARLEIRARKSS